jgi:hypothetical protein
MGELSKYYQEELLRHRPNNEIIDTIRQDMLKKCENLATVSAKLIRTIEEYIKKSRMNLEKDPFIDILVQKQIFSVYLTICYDIA